LQLPPTTTNNDIIAETTRTTPVVHRTLHDVAKCKRNIVISGLPESQPSYDRSNFLCLCEENLSLKPLVTESNLPNIPRRLLVRLTSDEAAAAVLKDVPKLRSSVSQYIARNVYINPDLLPDAAKLAYEARKLRRESIQQQLESRSSVCTDCSPALIDAMLTG